MAAAGPLAGDALDAGLKAACAGVWVASGSCGVLRKCSVSRWHWLAPVGTAVISGGSVCSMCARSVGGAASSSGWYALVRPGTRCIRWQVG